MGHDLKEHKPDYYEGILEMDVLLEAEQPAVDTLWRNLNTMDDPDADSRLNRGVRDNQFIQTSDAGKLTQDEALFNILADPSTESVDFRRQRLLNRWGLRPPFSEPWLRRQLDTLVGADKYDMTVDGNSYTLTIESAMTNQAFYHEIAVTIAYVKPCNLLFVYKPLVPATVTAGEELYLLNRVYNYHLGTTWNLGRKPFSSYRDFSPTYNYKLGDWRLGRLPFASYDGELIKLASQPSIQSPLLTDIAGFTLNDVAKARVNGLVVINAFQQKTVLGTQAVIAYNVMPTDVETITKVELLDSANNVLTSNTVYVPVVLGVVMTHKITVKEAN